MNGLREWEERGIGRGCFSELRFSIMYPSCRLRRSLFIFLACYLTLLVIA